MQTTPAPNKRLFRDEAATYLGISIFTLNAWESEGRAPPSIRVGRRSVYLRSDLDRFMAARQQQSQLDTESAVATWPAGSRVMRLREVCHLTGLSKTTLYKLTREGKFVPSISLGGASVGWPSHLVDAWLTTRLQKAMEVA